MQLLNIATNSITLFAAAYFLIALAAHLHHCWQHPPVKAAPIAAEEEFNLLEVIDSAGMLLLPAADAESMHPFEMSVAKMAAIEPIVALHQPAVEVEPIDVPAESLDFAALSIRELKRIASERKIPGYSKQTKSQLVELLTV